MLLIEFQSSFIVIKTGAYCINIISFCARYMSTNMSLKIQLLLLCLLLFLQVVFPQDSVSVLAFISFKFLLILCLFAHSVAFWMLLAQEGRILGHIFKKMFLEVSPISNWTAISSLRQQLLTKKKGKCEWMLEETTNSLKNHSKFTNTFRLEPYEQVEFYILGKYLQNKDYPFNPIYLLDNVDT